MAMVCLLPRAAAWHHPDACRRHGSDLPVLSQLELMLSWKPTIRCHWAGCDADVLDHFCEKPGHGVLVHWVLCHTQTSVWFTSLVPQSMCHSYSHCFIRQSQANWCYRQCVVYFQLRVLWRDVERFWIILGFYTMYRSEERDREAMREWTEWGSFYQQNFGDKYPCTRRFPTHVRTALLSGVNYRHVNYRCPGVCCPGVPAYFS